MRQDGSIRISHPGAPDFLIPRSYCEVLMTQQTCIHIRRFLIDSGVACSCCTDKIIRMVVDQLATSYPETDMKWFEEEDCFTVVPSLFGEKY
jgi:hypothetical protein